MEGCVPRRGWVRPSLGWKACNWDQVTSKLALCTRSQTSMQGVWEGCRQTTKTSAVTVVAAVAANYMETRSTGLADSFKKFKIRLRSRAAALLRGNWTFTGNSPKDLQRLNGEKKCNFFPLKKVVFAVRCLSMSFQKSLSLCGSSHFKAQRVRLGDSKHSCASEKEENYH